MLRCYRSFCNLQHALDATLLPFLKKCGSFDHVAHMSNRKRTMLLTDGATCYPKMSKELNLIYAWKCSAQSGRVHTHSVSWTWEGYLSHRYHWCCMVSIKRLHSQQFVFSQPRFVAVLQKLAMEVHKPSCELAEKTLETLKRIFWEKAARRQALWADENELALG